jgi:UrcA family protein
MLIKRALKLDARLLMAVSATVMALAPIYSHADESAKVKYANPTTVEAARHVYRQIETAANLACGQQTEDIEVMARLPGPCVHDAVSRAIQKINNPLIVQAYIDNNGKDEARKFGITSDAMSAKN